MKPPTQAPAPAALVAALGEAREVIVCLTDAELGGALDLLHDAAPAPQRVHVIWNRSDVDMLDALLRRGYNVFDGAVDGPSRLFLDRKAAYALPEYEPLSDVYARACQDWWARIGTFLLLSGRTEKLYPEQQVFQLRGREHFFIRVEPSKLPLPELGAEIDVIANCPWASSRTLLASAERIRLRSQAT